MRSSIPILVVEDDAIDVKNIKRAFAENHVLNPIQVVENGEQALAYLRREPPFEEAESAPRPGVILLDLNLPVMDGLTFLEQYKLDPSLRTIPTVVLTTSDEERDRLESYAIGVAGYIVKPVEFETFVDAVKRFDLYWTLCELP